MGCKFGVSVVALIMALGSAVGGLVLFDLRDRLKPSE